MAAAEPGLDDRDLDLARARARRTRRRSAARTGSRARRLAACGRPSRPPPRRAATAAPKASGSRSASPIRIRSANVVRCGDRNAPVRTPCASSSAAVIRTVELLPFVPTTWIAPEALLRASRARSAAGACARARSACRTARARAGAPRRARGARSLTSVLQLPLAAARACRARPATTASGALATKPWLASLPSARAISLLEPRARSAARALASASRSTASEASTATLPPGTPTVATGSPPFGATTRRARAARRARPCARSPRPRAAPGARAPGAAPTRSRQPRSSCTARDRARRPRPRRPRRRSASSGAGPAVRPSAGRRRRARSDQISSVTNGITGCASASVSAQHVQREPRRPRALSSAYRRGLSISRYQSHSSP